MKNILLVLFVILFCLSGHSKAERIKDLTSIEGVRDNQLVGYGLVVGLDGSGDKADFTMQSLKNMLTTFGIQMPANIKLKAKNVAAVAVHATLPPFARQGNKIDITVSSLGDSKSLRGGTLLLTPLKGINGEIYAIAQGNLMVGGLGISGADGSKVTVNIPSVGRIPGGAIIEKSVDSQFGRDNKLVLNLHDFDFTTAYHMVDRINKVFGADTASANNGGSVEIQVPENINNRVSFISMIENLDVPTGAPPAKVVVNSRTGTVVIGSNVRVMPAAVSHGNLVVTVGEDPRISQPGMLAQGQTAQVDKSMVQIEEEMKPMFLFNPGVSLNDIVEAVNAVGASPGDLAAILEALKEAKALKAELVII